MGTAQNGQIEFIKDLLRKSEKRKSILAKFGKKWQNVGTRTFDRRLKTAEAAIAAEQTLIKKEAEKNVVHEIQERKLKILPLAERLDILSDIAMGQLEIPTKKPVWDKEQNKFVMVPMPELPDHGTRIRAIAELNKMDGAYASSKVDVNVKTEVDLSNLTEEELNTLIAIKEKAHAG